jgi:hypothetical protein
MGRPSLKTPELCDEILSRIAKGEPLAVILREEGKPHQTRWNEWLREDEALAIAHTRAREAGFDVIAAESLAIIDSDPERVVTMSGDERSESRIDSASVQWLKNRAEHRLKLLAKWDPKRYGDKLAVGGDDDASPVKHTHEIVRRVIDGRQDA